MEICGIVAEYNPFHGGHSYHIGETRRRLGAETAVVCAMSGNFVQRGEAAVFSKNARAEAAVRCGADLVLELPLPWAIASAETFARGAVGMLAATGVVTHLSFGSESGELKELEEAERYLERPELKDLFYTEIAGGYSFAAARQRALEKMARRRLPVFAEPNNILAIEYLKAIRTWDLPLTPMTIRRAGAGHDSAAEDDMPSAALLREKIAAGEELRSALPEAAAEVFARETADGRGPVLPAALDTAIFSRLRMLPKRAFSDVPDAGEGLGNRLYRAVSDGSSLAAALEAAKTKRYALSRLRRMLLAAALGVRDGDSRGMPPYLRVLAANARGFAVLREMRGRAEVPVVTKPAEIRALPERAQRIFALESAATDLYVLGFPAERERAGDRDWRVSPFILPAEQTGGFGPDDLAFAGTDGSDDARVITGEAIPVDGGRTEV